MNRHTVFIALALALSSSPACLFSMNTEPNQDNNTTGNNSNNGNNTAGTNNTTVTNNNGTNNTSTNNTTSTNNIPGSACDVDAGDGECGGPASGYTCCGGTCVDTLDDLDHCGSCGYACDGEGQECVEGMCARGDSACGASETLISQDNSDVSAVVQPLLIRLDDFIFSCAYGLDSCPFVDGYVLPPVDDPAYVALYGTSSRENTPADTLNAVFVTERGDVLENSRAFRTRPGWDLLSMSASSDAFGAQVIALWRNRGNGGAEPAVELVFYDVPRVGIQGLSFDLTGAPSVRLLSDERVTAFDIIQVPIDDDDPDDDFSDLRAVIFGLVLDRGQDEGAAFQLYSTVIARNANGFFQKLDPFELTTSELDIDGARADKSVVTLQLGEALDAEGQVRDSVFVAVSSPSSVVNSQGRRNFFYNNVMYAGQGEDLEVAYPEFKEFGTGWTPRPGEYPADAYMPVTLIQQEGQARRVSALTTSSDPAGMGNGSSISGYLLSTDATDTSHIIGPASTLLARPGLYAFATLFEGGPWLESPALVGWLEGTVAEGVLGSSRSLRYAPFVNDGENSGLGEQIELVESLEQEWVEAFDVAPGGRSYGVLTVNKLSQGQSSEARFRAISADGQPICRLGD